MSSRASIISFNLSDVWDWDKESFNDHYDDKLFIEKLFNLSIERKVREGDIIRVVRDDDRDEWEYEFVEGEIRSSSRFIHDRPSIRSIVTHTSFHPNHWLNAHPDGYFFHIDQKLYFKVYFSKDDISSNDQYVIVKVLINGERWLAVIEGKKCQMYDNRSVLCQTMSNNLAKRVGLEGNDRAFYICAW